jgi:hypothetical protein
MVIAFQSVVALCAFAGLGALLQYARRTTLVAGREIVTPPEDQFRLRHVLRSNGQASGPN